MDFSLKEVQHFFDLWLQKQYPADRTGYNKVPEKSRWLKKNQIITLIRAVRPRYPSLLEVRGLQKETIRRFKMKASPTYRHFFSV